MQHRFDTWIAEHARAREQLLAAIEAYRAWLDQHGHVDIKRSLSIYDLDEQVRAERVRIAVVGRDAHARAAVLNLAGASTQYAMPLPASAEVYRCPLEIGFEAAASAHLALLPMETLRRDQPLAALKRHPGEWLRIELDLEDPQAIAEALARASEMQAIEKSGAGWIGSLDWLATQEGTADLARVPKWRYATLNLPWPVLHAGALLWDLPALDALAIDPEYARSVVGGTDALLLVVREGEALSASDLAAWRGLPDGPLRAVVSLPPLPAATQVDGSRWRADAATLLNVPVARFAALTSAAATMQSPRIPTDSASRAAVDRLGALLREFIGDGRPAARLEPMRDQLIGLLRASQAELRTKLATCDGELQELSALADKNRALARAMLIRLERERAAYTLHANSLRDAEANLGEKVRALSGRLQDGVLDTLFANSRREMLASWTTAGLRRGMEHLFEVFANHVDQSIEVARNAGEVIDGIYLIFQETLDLNSLLPPKLSLDAYVEAMQRLRQTTEGFCHDRKHLMTEKSVLIEKFYAGLASEARTLFQSARGELDSWFAAALQPITDHLKNEQRLLERRAENLRMLSEDLSGLQERVHQLTGKRAALQSQIDALERIESHAARASLRVAEAAADATQREASISRSEVLSTLP